MNSFSDVKSTVQSIVMVFDDMVSCIIDILYLHRDWKCVNRTQVFEWLLQPRQASTACIFIQTHVRYCFNIQMSSK